jgi:hypothetical protein
LGVESIAKLEQQLAAARTAHQAILTESLERLAPWPQHQQPLIARLPAEDALTRVLDAEAAYIEAMLSNALQLPDMVEGRPVLQLLEIPGRELHVYEHLKGNPTYLRSRLETVRLLLGQHKQRLFEQKRA